MKKMKCVVESFFAVNLIKINKIQLVVGYGLKLSYKADIFCLKIDVSISDYLVQTTHAIS